MAPQGVSFGVRGSWFVDPVERPLTRKELERGPPAGRIYRFKQELERSSKLPFASHWRERSLGGLVNLAQKEAAKLASRGGYGRSEHHAVSGEVIELNMR
jgi:hypothetical protein